MGRPSPTDDDGSFANPRRRRFRQANGHDVLLEDDVCCEANEGKIVAKVCRVVLWMDVLALLRIIAMGLRRSIIDDSDNNQCILFLKNKFAFLLNEELAH